MLTLDLSAYPEIVKFNKTKDDLVPFTEKAEFPAAFYVATVLSRSSVEKVKFGSWAHELYYKRKLMLDKADLKKLRDFIEDSEHINAEIGMQILEMMDAAKGETTKAKK